VTKEIFSMLNEMNPSNEMSKIHAPVILEDVGCPLGCSQKDEVLFSGSDLISHLPGEYRVIKCSGCGLVRTNPRPTADTIGFYYPNDYGPYRNLIEKNDQVKPRSDRIKNAFRPLIRRLFNSKAEALPSLQPGRLLEIGSASGSFLHKMSQLSWQVEGIEFSETAASNARNQGFRVHSGSLEKAPAPLFPPDLIVGLMVLEHLHDPIGCLSKLHDWTQPGAYLVLSMPNANALNFILFKEKGYDLHLPNHLYHFTPLTVEKILNKSGWTLEKVHHQRSLSNLLISTARVLESRGFQILAKCLRIFNGGGKWFYISFPFAWLLSLFGQTGRMTVWAKRI
jgi:SAM-dependent methyltransferase